MLDAERQGDVERAIGQRPVGGSVAAPAAGPDHLHQADMLQLDEGVGDLPDAEIELIGRLIAADGDLAVISAEVAPADQQIDLGCMAGEVGEGVAIDDGIRDRDIAILRILSGLVVGITVLSAHAVPPSEASAIARP